jgi:uncharacterized protein YcbK (DUF882 family)
MASKARHFQDYEFKCKCDSADCDAAEISPEIVAKLDRLRDDYGLPILIHSGSRCKYWNDKVGGVPDSLHLIGKAVDIRAIGVGKYRLAELAMKHGFTGIGVGQAFLHLDLRSIMGIWPAKKG